MIPKVIYQVSINLNHTHDLIQNQIEKTKKLNPTWEYKLITTEKELDNIVYLNFENEIVDCYNNLNILVAKVDFWRYLVLYKFGGVYLDIDSSINLNLDDLIKNDDDAIITAEGNPNLYVQWGLIFNKNHPILKKTIELIVENIKINKYPNNIHAMTGPTTYTNAINIIHKELYGDIIIHKNINKNTDITYNKNNISYRLYGIDYSDYFSFSYPNNNILFIGVKKWFEEQTIKPLLKSDLQKS
jgi:mannosyltransferase OCH1-like enzyme